MMTRVVCFSAVIILLFILALAKTYLPVSQFSVISSPPRVAVSRSIRSLPPTFPTTRPPTTTITYPPSPPISSSPLLPDFASFLDRLGPNNKVTIVGGIGDSGTRGVALLLKQFGISTLSPPNVNNAQDSRLLLHHYVLHDGSTVNFKSIIETLQQKSPKGKFSFHYSPSLLLQEKYEWAREWLSKVLYQTSLQFRPRERFGFKNPKSGLVLPLLKDLLHNRFQFIHVIRDGREVVNGANVKQLEFICNQKCDSYQNIWSNANQELFEFARDSGMIRDGQYFAIRSEDLVGGMGKHCYQDLMKFLQVDNVPQLDAIVNFTRQYRSSYFGNKLENRVLNETQSRMKRELEFWGYDTTRFNLSVDCLDLPWKKEGLKK